MKRLRQWFVTGAVTIAAFFAVSLGAYAFTNLNTASGGTGSGGGSSTPSLSQVSAVGASTNDTLSLNGGIIAASSTITGDLVAASRGAIGNGASIGPDADAVDKSFDMSANVADVTGAGPGGYYDLGKAYINISQATDTDTQIYGLDVSPSVVSGGAQYSSGIAAVGGRVFDNGTGRINEMDGGLFSVIDSGANIATSTYGVHVFNQAGNVSATATNEYGVDVQTGAYHGVVVNDYGINIEAPVHGASSDIQHNYALNIADQTLGDDNYAIKTGLGKVSFGDVASATALLSQTNVTSTGNMYSGASFFATGTNQGFFINNTNQAGIYMPNSASFNVYGLTGVSVLNLGVSASGKLALSSNELGPASDNGIDLGDATHRYRNGYYASGITVGGSATPATALEVFGTGTSSTKLTLSTLGANPVTDNLLCVSTTGTVYSEATSCTVSSARFKENIKNMDPHALLAEARKLHAVSYDWKDGYAPSSGVNGGGKESTGFIAEQVAAIDPQLVVYEVPSAADLAFEKKNYPDSILHKDGKVLIPKTVDYSRVSVVLDGAIQAIADKQDQQQAEIDALAHRVSLVEKIIKWLESLFHRG